MNIEQEIDNLLMLEGGFVDDPTDNGGATKYGITQQTLTNWLGRDVSKDEVKRMDRRTAREIYYALYYIKPGFNLLPMLLQPVIIDTAVNMGQKKAIKLLQDALLCHGFDCGKLDGKLGDKTIASAKAAVDAIGNELITLIVRRRVIAYENIVKADETQRKFLHGWINRAESFLPEKVTA